MSAFDESLNIAYLQRAEVYKDNNTARKEKYIKKDMRVVKVFIDLETTGNESRKHSIHQIAGIIEIDGEAVERFDFKVQPHPKCLYDKAVLEKSGVTEEQVKAYPPMKTVHKKIIALLGKYINKFNREDKAYLVGYNNRSFDDVFFRKWFIHNGDEFFGSWFYADSLDVMVLACEYLIPRRVSMTNFKLSTVAREIGLEVDEKRLHDASYDIGLTRDMYRIVTGIEVEM